MLCGGLVPSKHGNCMRSELPSADLTPDPSIPFASVYQKHFFFLLTSKYSWHEGAADIYSWIATLQEFWLRLALHRTSEGTLLLGEDMSSTVYQSRLDLGHFLYSFPPDDFFFFLKALSKKHLSSVQCSWLQPELAEKCWTNWKKFSFSFLPQNISRVFGQYLELWNPPRAPLCNSKSFFHSVSSILKACELILWLQNDFSVYQIQRDAQRLFMSSPRHLSCRHAGRGEQFPLPLHQHMLWADPKAL